MYEKGRSVLISIKKISMWCLCGFGKHLEVRIVQQKNTVVPINDINVLHCQSSQLCSGSWKYPFHFWLYHRLNNTICSVTDMLIFLSHVNFLCQTEVRETVAKLARSPLHSLHRGPAAVRVEGQLRTAQEKAAICFQSCCIRMHSLHFQASSRDLVFLDVPSEARLMSLQGTCS